MGTAKTTADLVRSLADPVLAHEGYELLDVELVSERGRAILRLYIDSIPPSTKERGIGVEDCATVSRVVGDLLDVEDAIDGNYTLEVSSPGLFRPLTKPEHWDRHVGERVKVKTFAKHHDRKVFIGILKGREGGSITVDVDGTLFALELVNVAKANLEPLL